MILRVSLRSFAVLIGVLICFIRSRVQIRRVSHVGILVQWHHPRFIPCEDDFPRLTAFRLIYTPVMTTKGLPIPNLTPRPTLRVSEVELVLGVDAGASI